LLVNDSVTVALALNQGITALASADKDFERVKELAVYSPTDIADRA
jgi:predicted nucleic acid-binding protein